MYFVRACVIVCVLRFHGAKELLKEVNDETRMYLRNAIETEAKFMKLVLNGGTSYTDLNKPCVSAPTTIANGARFDIPPLPDLPQGCSILHIGVDQTKSYTAYTLRKYTVDTVGRQLQDVVQDCIKSGDDFEGYVRITNAVESAGMTAIHRFCHLTIAILNKPEAKMNDATYNLFEALLVYMQMKYTVYHITTRPIEQIRAAVGVLKVKTDNILYRIIFFMDTCTELSQRYRNMIDFLTPGIYSAEASYATSELSMLKELKRNIYHAIFYFSPKVLP